MAINYHPKRGTIVTVNFDEGFRKPEMVKKRLCVVMSPAFEDRGRLCTVVPLSLSEPNPKMEYHCKVTIPFQLPKYWGNEPRWVKGDMICAVGFHRIDLLRMGKDRSGARIYQKNTLSKIYLDKIYDCIASGISPLPLTKTEDATI